VLALIAGRVVSLDPAEVRGAQRRGVQLLATGGDPQRDLDLNGRAVLAVATDLETDERREALVASLAALRGRAEGLSHVTERIDALAADPGLAWRWFAVTLLAEELSPD
jgi:hypothetical protein